MPEIWYEKVNPDSRLLQGDLIHDCPLVGWQDNEVEIRDAFDGESLSGMITAVSADVVVMTQSCDLEQNKVKNVLLCPHISLREFREAWARQMQEKGQNPTEKAWKNICDDICGGRFS
jgi:hypothetical protein